MARMGGIVEYTEGQTYTFAVAVDPSAADGNTLKMYWSRVSNPFSLSSDDLVASHGGILEDWSGTDSFGVGQSSGGQFCSQSTVPYQGTFVNGLGFYPGVTIH